MARPPADDAPANATPELVSERYRRLIDELGAREGKRHGWRARVAARLGIRPQALSNIVAGDMRVGWNLAHRASERLNLDRRYFTTEGTPEDWLVLMDLANQAEPERERFELSMGDLRRRARDLRRMLEAPPDRRTIVEVLRFAQDVLDSRPVRRAHAVRTAEAKRQLDAGLALAQSFIDEYDPFDNVDLVAPTDRAAWLLNAQHHAMAEGIQGFVRAASEQGLSAAKIRAAIEKEIGGSLKGAAEKSPRST